MFLRFFHCADDCQVEGQAMILGDEGWPVAMAKGMQVGAPPRVQLKACRKA